MGIAHPMFRPLDKRKAVEMCGRAETKKVEKWIGHEPSAKLKSSRFQKKMTLSRRLKMNHSELTNQLFFIAF